MGNPTLCIAHNIEGTTTWWCWKRQTTFTRKSIPLLNNTTSCKGCDVTLYTYTVKQLKARWQMLRKYPSLLQTGKAMLPISFYVRVHKSLFGISLITCGFPAHPNQNASWSSKRGHLHLHNSNTSDDFHLSHWYIAEACVVWTLCLQGGSLLVGTMNNYKC